MREGRETNAVELTGRPVSGGKAQARLLVLSEPLSFWGGVDPRSGLVADPRHPHHGESLQGRILVMERTIGSSSSSAIMLEMLRSSTAPSGIVVGAPDAILVLGVLVAEELGYPTIPCLEIGTGAARRLRRQSGSWAELRDDRLSIRPRANRTGRVADNGAEVAQTQPAHPRLSGRWSPAEG